MEHGGFISRKYVTKIIISYTDLDVEDKGKKINVSMEDSAKSLERIPKMYVPWNH